MLVRAGNADIFVKDQGAGTPVLFLHGNPDTADVWNDVIGLMQQEHRCVAPDLPGFGRSTAPRNFDASFENLGRFVDELVDAVRLPLPLNLVTHDFGGAFGMAWAIQHADKLRRIVAINHPFFVADYRWHIWARIWRTPLLGEVSLLSMNWPVFYQIMHYGSRRLPRERIRQVYASITPEWKRTVLRLYRAATPAAFRAWEPRMRQLTARVRTRVLWGNQDPWVPAWIADRFGAERVVRFPDSGHWVPLEEPDKVAAEIGAFVDG